MAVVQCDRDAAVHVKFFTCGDRVHPSAPLTGLAVLAIAGARLGWTALTSSARVVTRAGAMALPGVVGRVDGTVDLTFPPLLVELDHASLADAGAADACVGAGGNKGRAVA
jgi:hypothetical protein